MGHTRHLVLPATNIGVLIDLRDRIDAEPGLLDDLIRSTGGRALLGEERWSIVAEAGLGFALYLNVEEAA